MTILQKSKFASRNFPAQKSVESRQNRTFQFFNSFCLDFMLPATELKIKIPNFPIYGLKSVIELPTLYPFLSEIKIDMPNLKVIQHKEKYGQSAAISTGVIHAEGKLIVTMDGDGQNDPSDIPKLISTLLDNKTCRMVGGYRKKRNDSLWRIISSKIANSIRSFLLTDNTPDTGCGLKVFYKTAFTALPFFDHMHRFLPALIKMQGGDVISVEVNHRARKHGKSCYGTLDRLWAGIIDIMGVYWLCLRSKKILIREISND